MLYICLFGYSIVIIIVVVFVIIMTFIITVMEVNSSLTSISCRFSQAMIITPIEKIHIIFSKNFILHFYNLDV